MTKTEALSQHWEKGDTIYSNIYLKLRKSSNVKKNGAEENQH